MHYNKKTRITASIMGTLLGIAGFLNHGIFEILQGSVRTNGLLIEAISEQQRFWIHGTEGALTLIPNFLITGICVLLVSVFIVVWSVRFIHKKHGAMIFLISMILLTLVGGGLGHIVVFLPVWAFATRINKPLLWWRKVLSEKVKNALAKLWLPALVLTIISWLIVMELGIFGIFPGQDDPDVILNICFGFVLLTVLLASISFICGFARDIVES